MSKFDLSSLDTVKGSNEGFDVNLYNPSTNEDIGIIVTVLGKDSDVFNKISKQQNKKRMDRLSKNGFRAGKVASPSQDEVEADNIELLASCSTGWKTVDGKDSKDSIPIDKKDLPFSIENAKAVYARFPWIKEQIDVAIGDRANFIKA